MTKVSVVVPVYNQADHIREVVDGYRDALAKLPFEHEIVLVPNACRDDSAEICHKLAGSSGGSIRVVELERGGWGRAVKAGVAAAGGDVICYTNSARTRPEELTLLLLYAHAFPGAVVKANRKIRDSRRRRLGSLLYNLECRALFDIAAWDVNGTPKVFSREHARLLTLDRDDDLIDVEFVARCIAEDYPIVEVPIIVTRRHGGESTTKLKSAVRMYLGAWQLKRTWR